jgi:glucose-6-phosphate isomerase
VQTLIARYSSVDLAGAERIVDSATKELAEHNAVQRMWQRDPTLWKPRPEDDVELSDRLGWLDLPVQALEWIADLETFANQQRQRGIKHAIVCGMGGSSLAPEVFRITFPRPVQAIEPIVLDSTDPGVIRDIDNAIDPSKTVFVISSKSGGTLEVMSFFAHFWELAHGDGRQFVAITDPGTSLEKLASERQFARVFLNPTEIGGRYSALSLFGLVPAVLGGVDINKLLEAARSERDLSQEPRPDRNPGAWLGAFMGGLARAGRDKLTLLASPGLASFGLWVEQLIAESTGKEGKGIVPIVGEPFGGPDVYGDDRAFVALRLEGDDNAELDRHVEGLKGRHPLVVRTLADRYELGAEMYTWEVATALAGALLEINPFDQPNVQESKENTARVLREGATQPPFITDLKELLKQTRAGDYVALQAYLTPTDAIEARLQRIRAQIRDRHRVATTLGFGPRFLHSTGQLHKGGPPSGVFVQFTYQPTDDVTIPGQPFGFGELIAAQANGDLLSLHSRGLRLARIHLGDDVLVGLDRIGG